jgi:hypothetical protein
MYVDGQSSRCRCGHIYCSGCIPSDGIQIACACGLNLDGEHVVTMTCDACGSSELRPVYTVGCSKSHLVCFKCHPPGTGDRPCEACGRQSATNNSPRWVNVDQSDFVENEDEPWTNYSSSCGCAGCYRNAANVTLSCHHHMCIACFNRLNKKSAGTRPFKCPICRVCVTDAMSMHSLNYYAHLKSSHCPNSSSVSVTTTTTANPVVPSSSDTFK